MSVHFNIVIQTLKKYITKHFSKKTNTSSYELCVLCNKITSVSKDTPIESRDYYIIGAGQLCSECYQKVEESEINSKTIEQLVHKCHTHHSMH